jgi:hypothetical protein
LAIGTKIYEGDGVNAASADPAGVNQAFDSEHETMVISSTVEGIVENGEGSITGDYEAID